MRSCGRHGGLEFGILEDFVDSVAAVVTGRLTLSASLQKLVEKLPADFE